MILKCLLINFLFNIRLADIFFYLKHKKIITPQLCALSSHYLFLKQLFIYNFLIN